MDSVSQQPVIGGVGGETCCRVAIHLPLSYVYVHPDAVLGCDPGGGGKGVV